MPTTQDHIDKQTDTQITMSYLQQSQDTPQHADWIVTTAFYKALHAVDSYLAGLDIHPRGMHGTRHVLSELILILNL